jgi:uncharacterized membrane protein YfcA
VPELLHFAVVLFVAFIAATLAAVTGFGGAAVLLPALVATFGVMRPFRFSRSHSLWVTAAGFGSIARNWTGGWWLGSRWVGYRPKTTWRPPVYAFAPIGAGASFLSALLGSVGPLMAPFFLAYGLVKGAYIGTEALCTVVMHITKLIAYREAAVLPFHAVLVGLMLGPMMVLGSFTGKRIVDRLPETVFIWLVEATLVAAGVLFVCRA